MVPVRSCAIATSCGRRSPTIITVPTPIRLKSSMAGFLPFRGSLRGPRSRPISSRLGGYPVRIHAWAESQHQECHFFTLGKRGVPTRGPQGGGHPARDPEGATRARSRRDLREMVFCPYCEGSGVALI